MTSETRTEKYSPCDECIRWDVDCRDCELKPVDGNNQPITMGPFGCEHDPKYYTEYKSIHTPERWAELIHDAIVWDMGENGV